MAGLDAFAELVEKIMDGLVPVAEGLAGKRNELIAGGSCELAVLKDLTVGELLRRLVDLDVVETIALAVWKLP